MEKENLYKVDFGVRPGKQNGDEVSEESSQIITRAQLVVVNCDIGREGSGKWKIEGFLVLVTVPQFIKLCIN